MRKPACNDPLDHAHYPVAHASNASRNYFSRYGRECPVHGPTAREAVKNNTCKDSEPEPDPYISPHNVDARAAERNYVKIPVYEKGYAIEYPHRDWLDARELYAKDPERHPLDTVLMHVTEDNPPPGPPIPVYKPVVEQERKPDHMMFFAVFGYLFMLAGMLPLLLWLF